MECTELTHPGIPCQCDYCQSKREMNDDVVLEPSQADLLAFAMDSARTDVAYAIRQLREFGDQSRALDALDRALESLTPTAIVPSEWTPQQILDREG